METIRSYLDTMFRTLPYTPETARLREELLANMEDKYHALKAQGKSENEAIGIVISEFGNIDELLEEMNLPSGFGGPAVNGHTRPFGRTVELAEVTRFLEARRMIALLIAAGVFLCITAPAVFLLVEEVAVHIIPYASANIAIAVLFLFVAIAVGMFIYAGYLGEPYEYLEKEPFVLTPEAHGLSEAGARAQRGKSVLATIAGVITILMSPVVYMLVSALIGPDTPAIALMLFMVAAAVFGFCYFGTLTGSFDRLLQREEYSEQHKKRDRVIGAVAAVWWPLIVCAYLVWSFTSGDWGQTWIIWPVSALLFAAFSGGYAVLTDNKLDG